MQGFPSIQSYGEVGGKSTTREESSKSSRREAPRKLIAAQMSAAKRSCLAEWDSACSNSSLPGSSEMLSALASTCTRQIQWNSPNGASSDSSNPNTTASGDEYHRSLISFCQTARYNAYVTRPAAASSAFQVKRFRLLVIRNHTRDSTKKPTPPPSGATSCICCLSVITKGMIRETGC